MEGKLKAFKEKMKGARVSVLGVGISNLPLIELLAGYGARVVARDKKDEHELFKTAEKLRALGVSLRLGEDYLADLDEEIIFKTPGIRHDLPELLAARGRGSVITSEMEVFFELCPAKIIGITGSDGKTTTTTLIYNMLIEEGYICHLGGNIGRPLIGDIEKIMPEDFVVLELSSFQLQTLKASPHIAVITNISPNHLDVHKSMEEYIGAKKNIFLYQTPDSRLVVNLANSICAGFKGPGETVFFTSKGILKRGVYLEGGYICHSGEQVLAVSDISLPGAHNVENFMAAVAAVWGLVEKRNIEKVAKSFLGVSHRIELVRKLGGVRFYNDSIATTPTRARAALYAFDQKVILIAGGYDKLIPFDDFGADIVKRVKALYLIGDTAEKIRRAVSDAGGGVSATLCASLDEAVALAYKGAAAGDVILLSPACASFGIYENFEKRGEHFKEIVKEL